MNAKIGIIFQNNNKISNTLFGIAWTRVDAMSKDKCKCPRLQIHANCKKEWRSEDATPNKEVGGAARTRKDATPNKGTLRRTKSRKKFTVLPLES